MEYAGPLGRMGNLAAPAYQQLPSALRQSLAGRHSLESGRTPAESAGLLNEQVTVNVIEAHRGYTEAAAILGADYAGFLVHDGARCFYGFAQALHQSCLEHLIRQSREMIQMPSRRLPNSR